MEQIRNRIDPFYRTKNEFQFLEYEEECCEIELHEKIDEWNAMIDTRRQMLNDLKTINTITKK